MADPETRWADNTPGRFFVDENCIDCDLCRTTAPHNFQRSEEGGYSFVGRQPQGEREEADCLQAQADCPVDAIGDEQETP
jgi:ferredoxin